MPNDYLLLDQVLAESGDLNGCIEALQKALTIAPYNNFVYQRLAMRQFQLGDLSAAEQTIRRGLELHPEDSALREMQDEATRQGLGH